MTLSNVIMFLVVGGLAGYAASTLIRGYGLGLLGNIVVGIVGAFVGLLVLGLLGVAFAGVVGTLLTAFIGAVILLGLVGVVRPQNYVT